MDDWIEWNGGELPVSDNTLVDIKFRSGRMASASFANTWHWEHHSAGGLGDIVAYRITESDHEA